MFEDKSKVSLHGKSKEAYKAQIQDRHFFNIYFDYASLLKEKIMFQSFFKKKYYLIQSFIKSYL